MQRSVASGALESDPAQLPGAPHLPPARRDRPPHRAPCHPRSAPCPPSASSPSHSQLETFFATQGDPRHRRSAGHDRALAQAPHPIGGVPRSALVDAARGRCARARTGLEQHLTIRWLTLSLDRLRNLRGRAGRPTGFYDRRDRPAASHMAVSRDFFMHHRTLRAIARISSTWPTSCFLDPRQCVPPPDS